MSTSTRCVINFGYVPESGPLVIAKVYRHFDGYDAGKDLEQFFADVRAQAELDETSPRFHDPSYLAAKFVVWQAARYMRSTHPLIFRGVGIVVENPSDIACEWFVLCCTDGNATPRVAQGASP